MAFDPGKQPKQHAWTVGWVVLQQGQGGSTQPCPECMRGCLPALQATLFESRADDAVLKVLVELRDNTDNRQFINSDALLEQCNSAASKAAIRGLNAE